MGIEDALVEPVKNLKIDPSSILDARDPEFVVEPEFRPKAKHNEFAEDLLDQIPIIDLSPLRVQDEEGIKKVVEEVGKAAEEWGFFQVVNHGVPLSLIDTLETEALAFFLLPLEEKKKIGRTLEQPLGYFDRELTKNRRDWKEVFDFLVKDFALMSNADGTEDRKLTNRWPEEPAGLRYYFVV